jgi:hypothetical protein
MTKKALAAVLVVLSAGFAFGQGSLPTAVRKAKKAAQDARLAIELRRMSEVLKPQGDADDLGELASQGKAGVAKLRSEQLSLEGVSVLDKLDAMYAELPNKTWAKDYAADLAEIVAVTPSWAADEGGTTQEMTSRLDAALALPDAAPEEPGFSWIFPEDVPLAEFRKIDPIRVFLMKHRIRRPKKSVKTTPEALVGGTMHVETGAEVEGVVTWTTTDHEFDRDYCFNIGDLHLEITPEWMLTHPHFPKPKLGQRVRAKGWTYYDYFHKAEHEYDPKDPVLGAERATLWEIHPVQELTVLP